MLKAKKNKKFINKNEKKKTFMRLVIIYTKTNIIFLKKTYFWVD